QQGGRAGEAASSDFSIYIRGVAIGSEQISVSRTAEGWTIASTGRLSAPLNVVTRRLQLRYDSNWKASELPINTPLLGHPLSLKPAVGTRPVTNEFVNGTEASNSTAMVNSDVLLPTPFFAAYEALAARLKSAPRGSTIAGYAPPQTAVTIQVGESVVEHIQT